MAARLLSVNVGLPRDIQPLNRAPPFKVPPV